MTLKKIRIQNIKGIQDSEFNLEIIPNKPSLLVAPNGFGKSSFALGFKKMNNNRIVLEDGERHLEDAANQPTITIDYKKPDDSEVTLVADHNSNTISSEFDWFVINNQSRPKGIASPYGSATASLIIEPVTIVDTVPESIDFAYSFASFKTNFGDRGVVLPNANSLLGCRQFVAELPSLYTQLQRLGNQSNSTAIQGVKDLVNTQTGTGIQLREWVSENCLNQLRAIDYLQEVAETIGKYSEHSPSETSSYLLAVQIAELYGQDSTAFKKAVKYSNYKLKKENLDSLLEMFDTTWKGVRSSQTQGKLIVKFPKATQISNGQRDVLSLITLLIRAEIKLQKDAGILIIDEVFDYLDDANLVAAQYYVSKFIEAYKANGRRLYPLILTHLNPRYFKNFVFRKQKVYYLNKSTITPNASLVKLLRNRDDATIKEDVSKFLFHYHPNQINKRAEFLALNLRQTWGESDNFYRFVKQEVAKYLNGDNYSPLAVCCAVRIEIEKQVYDSLATNQNKIDFLEVHTTKNKLEFADSLGVEVNEAFSLLGIIYNEGLHWKENSDNISPIASKLENLIIRNLIEEIFG